MKWFHWQGLTGGNGMAHAYTVCINGYSGVPLRSFAVLRENMKNYKKRILFGGERHMSQPGKDVCGQCGCGYEHTHLPGCAGEECPACGKVLIGCCCESLSPYDAEKIIQGLYSQFTDLESALHSAGEEACPAGGKSSYLQHAVMRYIFANVPDTARTEIARVFHLRFPGLIPHLQDEEGRGYYTAEQLSEALDIPLQEVNERIDAMATAGRSIHMGEGKKLRKIH